MLIIKACVKPYVSQYVVTVVLYHFIAVGAYGREGDAGIFSQSKFGSQLIAGQLSLQRPECLLGTQTLSLYVFVGYKAFHLRVNLMEPYPGSSGLDDTKKIYNYLHSSHKNFRELLWDPCCKMLMLTQRPL
ncbi:unnamed protein product [Oncorhynchus mykiss]|uniref:Uncharacterized protein n=1 Tax=Oncorhynchus mykiss TaxID=8022 RepID=A0A060XFX0_ONCMY|nr:unnamed protein product [Oncorhynchus mykiss]